MNKRQVRLERIRDLYKKPEATLEELTTEAIKRQEKQITEFKEKLNNNYRETILELYN